MENDIPQNTLLGNKKGHYYLKAFLIPAIIAIVLFLPFIIMDKGYFLYYGDFNVQQIPFYQMIHDSIQNGNFGWSNTTDLGADIVGSYSFYMIASPFFWLAMLFPSPAVPHLMGPLYVLKFACCSLSAFVYLKRYVKNKDYAVIGGILYAFSGFGVYNIFFNHFHEAMITFPLLLAAVDEIMYTGRKGVLVITAFLSWTINYYFFAGQAVFAILYWLVKLACGDFEFTFKKLIQIIFEAVLGFAASAFIFLPTLATITENPRISNSPSGWSALLYGWEQRYMHIIESFFFPPDLPARPNFTPDSNAKWASVAAYLPMFSMVGVFSFMKLRKKKYKWLKYLLPILFLCALVPILNSAFQLFNASYYARWYYMLTLVMVLATILCLDSERANFKYGLNFTFGITVGIAAAIGLMPKTEKVNGIETTTYGLMEYPERFWIYVAFALIGLVLTTIVLYLWKNKNKNFMKVTSILLSIFCAGYSLYIVGTGKDQGQYKSDFIISDVIDGGNRLELDDIKDVRSDFYDCMDNMGMFWQIPTIQAFQSVVPGSIMEFYESVGVERSVASRPEADYYGLRSFLSCKYLFNYNGKFRNVVTKETKMPYWTYLNKQNNFDVYTNDCYIPYGFTYDEYITEKQYEQCSESNRHLLLLKAMVLTDEQAEKYGDILTKAKNIYKYEYTEEEYKKDCENRNKLTCTDTKFDNGGFTSHITTKDSDELVFFSVPYTKGWTAYVNGKQTDIEKVNVGFMAVRVPANTRCEIRFDYKTPNFTLGLGVTGACVVVFIAYMLIPTKLKKKKEGKHALSEDNIEADEIDISSYANSEVEENIPQEIEIEPENSSQDKNNESDLE